MELLATWRPEPGTVLYLLALMLWGFAMGVEALYAGVTGRSRYGLRDTLANLSMYTGYVLVSLVWVQVLFVTYTWLHSHALLHLSVGGWHVGTNRWWEWVVLLLLEDLCFYGFHRMSHQCRFFWASHVNHHSSTHFNLSVAMRQTWTPFVAALFWLPLPLLGFDPLMVITMQALSLFYQLWLHTEVVGHLGPLEWVFNTPRHHRIHHAADPRYHGKNLGGILIVWDRLFGTYAEAETPEDISYGLGEDLGYNPVWIAFHEWAAIVRDVRKSGSLRDRLTSLVRERGS